MNVIGIVLNRKLNTGNWLKNLECFVVTICQRNFCGSTAQLWWKIIVVGPSIFIAVASDSSTDSSPPPKKNATEKTGSH